MGLTRNSLYSATLVAMTRAEAMSTRAKISAITRGSAAARPGAALILGGLLLLSVP